MVDKIYINRIKKIAEDYYRNGDFFCSEAVLKTIIDEFNVEITDDVIKLASGFPVGIGHSGCTCGAISGGVMAIGLFFGRKTPKDPSVNETMTLSAELYNIFKVQHKSTCCKVLTKNMELGSSEHMEQCISFTGEIAVETAKLIAHKLNIGIID